MKDAVLNFFAWPGYRLLQFVRTLGEMSILAGESLWLILQGKVSGSNLKQALMEIGYNSLPIISFTSLFTGMVLVVQVGNQFLSLGAEILVGGVVGLSLTREMAPLIVSTILAARVGSSMSAEIGTMKVTEQIDALQVMATNPVQYLVAPRILASILFTPVLVIYANIVGILGGMLVAVFQIGVSSNHFIRSLVDNVQPHDVYSGLLKSAFFGFLVALIGCYKGLNTEGGAKGVGEATTQCVVICITSILVFNYFFS